MTEIVKTTTENGQPIYELRGAIVQVVGDELNGVSKKTGNAWKMRFVNVRIDNGEGKHSDYMRLKFVGTLADQAASLMHGQSRINAKVEFNITNGAYQNNDIKVYSFEIG